ncbi:MAG: hypothetical protein P0S94_04765 [Simkaniaceae bacterium]|nr:hypothetical protein [Simkaniaceae bacterium]
MVHHHEATEAHKKRARRVERKSIDRQRKSLKKEFSATSRAPSFIVSGGRGSGNIFLAIAKSMDGMNKGSLMQEYSGALQMRAENAIQTELNSQLGAVKKKMQSALNKLEHPPKEPLWKKILFPIIGIFVGVALSAVMGPIAELGSAFLGLGDAAGDAAGAALSTVASDGAAAASEITSASTSALESAATDVVNTVSTDVSEGMSSFDEMLTNATEDTPKKGRWARATERLAARRAEGGVLKAGLKRSLGYMIMTGAAGGIGGYMGPEIKAAGDVKTSNNTANGELQIAQVNSQSIGNRESIANNDSQQTFSTDESDQLQDQNFDEQSFSGIIQGQTSSLSGMFSR